MQYLIRLLIIPACWALAVYALIACLRIELPYHERHAALFLLLGIPFVAAFNSQLHRIDMLHRIEKLERDVEQLQLDARDSERQG